MIVLRTLLTQDVIWMSFQCLLDVIDVRWTSKQRCVLNGNCSKIRLAITCYNLSQIDRSLIRMQTKIRLLISKKTD